MIKRIILLIVFGTFLILPAASASAFGVLTPACSQSGGSSAGSSSICAPNTPGNPIFGPNSVLDKIINILSVVGGIVAIFAIIVAGFLFITSGGDPARVGTARNTILFVAIGLVVIAIAQIIEVFVINNISPRV